MKKFLLILSVSAVCAAAAMADTITMQSNGTMSLSGTSPVTFTGSDTVSFWFHPSGSLPLANLTGGSESEAGTLNGADLSTGYTSIATFTNVAATDSLTISFATTTSVSQSGGYSVGGAWTYLSGVGSYAGLAGGGTFSATITPTNTAGYNIDLQQVNGSLQAAPEPISLGVLAIGAVALLKRKIAG